MEIKTLHDDIPVFYLRADSFPDGVLDAHKKLHTLVPFSPARKYFGLSRPENGVIAYKAAAEELVPGEGEKLNGEMLVIPKGNYISETIPDFMKTLSLIGQTFKQLLAYPGIDPSGYCVEWYINEMDLICMVRLSN